MVVSGPCLAFIVFYIQNKRCKNLNERVTQTLCILNFPIWKRHEMDLNIQWKRVLPRELHFPFPKKWKYVCKVAVAEDD